MGDLERTNAVKWILMKSGEEFSAEAAEERVCGPKVNFCEDADEASGPIRP
jgi:hypothetical protein